MADPPIFIDNENTARYLAVAAEAGAKKDEQVGHAKHLRRRAAFSVLVAIVVTLLLYRIVLSHLGTMLTCVVGVVLMIVAASAASTLIDRPKRTPVLPPQYRSFAANPRTGEAVHEALYGDTKHYTAAGAQDKAKGAADGLASAEAAVSRAAAFLLGGWIVFVWGFVSLLFSPVVGVLLLLAVLVVGLVALGR